MKASLGSVLLGVGLIFGLYDLGVLLNYLSLFFFQVENPARSEYLISAAIGSMSATPAWLSASLGVVLLKNNLHPIIRFSVYFITVLVLALLMYFLFVG